MKNSWRNNKINKLTNQRILHYPTNYLVDGNEKKKRMGRRCNENGRREIS